MRDGRIVARGSEAFAHALGSATEVMQRAGRTTAASEMHSKQRETTSFFLSSSSPIPRTYIWINRPNTMVGTD